jgi:hypothetical protein
MALIDNTVNQYVDVQALTSADGARWLGLRWPSHEQSVSMDQQGLPWNGGWLNTFLCPVCDARVHKIYLYKDRFQCRKCTALPYRSANSNKRKRLLGQIRKLRRRLGDSSNLTEPVSRPKGMWWRTYMEALEKLRELEKRYFKATMRVIRR